MHRIRRHLTYANIISTLALFLVLGGGTALAATYVVSSNSQVAPNTISGHGGSAANKNIISGSVNVTDLANQAVTAAKIKAPEAWHAVAAGSNPGNACTDATKTTVFCTELTNDGTVWTPWTNFGGGNATAAFYKDQLGIVHLKGLVVPPNQGVTTSSPYRREIFRLPAAYRPQSTRVFPSVSRSVEDSQDVAQARVDVQSDGQVVLEQDCETPSGGCSGDTNYLTLDGITFRPTE
jgi:hypothetical protein